MSRDDQMFNIFLSLGNFSKKFLLVASSSLYENKHPRRIQFHHLISILEWSPFSDAMIQHQLLALHYIF